MCPCIGNNHPIWPIFFRGVETTNQYGKLEWGPTFGFTSGSWIWVEQILIWPGPGGGIEPIEPIHKKGIGGFCGNHPQMSELFRLVIYFKLQLDMIGGVTPTIRSGASFMGVVQWKHRLEIWGCHGWNQMLHAGVSAKNVTWVLHFNMGKASKYWMI